MVDRLPLDTPRKCFAQWPEIHATCQRIKLAMSRTDAKGAALGDFRNIDG